MLVDWWTLSPFHTCTRLPDNFAMLPVCFKHSVTFAHKNTTSIKHWSAKPSALSQSSSNHTLKHMISLLCVYSLIPRPFSPCWRAWVWYKAILILLISLHLERHEISFWSVHQAFCIRSPRKATAVKAAVVKLVSRGLAWREINKRQVHTVTHIFTLFKVKWNQQYRMHFALRGSTSALILVTLQCSRAWNMCVFGCDQAGRSYSYTAIWPPNASLWPLDRRFLMIEGFIAKSYGLHC